MTLTSATSLPCIPSLPPLEMPESSYLSSKPRQSHRTGSSSSLRQQSLASATSKESFATAYTSSPLGTPTHSQSSEFSPLSPNPQKSLAPPQNLRKSISVDSFVNYGRDIPTTSGTRPNRVNTGSALDPPRGLLRNHSLAHRQEPDIRTLDQSRGRGMSMSTTGESLGDEYDLEREEENSMKGKEKNPPSLPGQLVLPSRVPALSSASSMSSLTSGPSSSSPRETSHRLHSTTSMQSIASRAASNSAHVAASARSRSGSLGINVANLERQIHLNTQVAVSDKSNQPEVVLLVVGASGCGKSTAIHKGLKAYRPLESTACSVPLTSLGVSPVLHYHRRTGRIPPSENSPERALHVLDVDSSDLDPSASASSVWPEDAPRLDGVLICYDSSNESSFVPVEDLLWRFRALSLPTIVLACKSDLAKRVDPQMAVAVLRRYDVGLVEVTKAHDEGKDKMRRSFDWLLKAIFREPHILRGDLGTHYRNPASPDYLASPPPWDMPRSAAATPTASSSVASISTTAPAQTSAPRILPLPLTLHTPRSPAAPTSPTRARSTSDLLSEHERSKNRDKQIEQDSTRNMTVLAVAGHVSTVSLHEPSSATTIPGSDAEETREDRKEAKEKDSRPAQWATLDELLDKLIFLAVSGDDSAYISNFLLTYRRFASPRSILLAMQKRIRQLDNPSGDPMFACFAQMRICALLETWIRDYPHDFAVRGTSGALSALVRTVIGKTYLLHYGCDFLPFLEYLPNLIDEDGSWALKVEDIADESDDYKLDEEDDDDMPIVDAESPSSSQPSDPLPNGKSAVAAASSTTRERKSSLPLSAMGTFVPNSTPTIASSSSDEVSPKQIIRDLLRISQDVLNMDSDEIAQEITRIEVQLFLDIKPRHWLQFTLATGKKEPYRDPITRFNQMSNHIADWVVSLILCHEKPRARARQVEKFVDIAQKLRALNNYSALRAFVAGINNATFPGDPTMERFKADSPEAYKNFQSWDLLLQHIRSHSAYRMALRNTKGACIPALEVHMSDLIRAHEGNPDFNPSDHTKIHWAKFNMIGKFISSTKLCQTQCQNTTDYNFPERPYIREPLLKEPLMDEEMQRSRITPPGETEHFDDFYRPSLAMPPRMGSRDTPSSSQSRIARILRR